MVGKDDYNIEFDDSELEGLEAELEGFTDDEDDDEADGEEDIDISINDEDIEDFDVDNIEDTAEAPPSKSTQATNSTSIDNTNDEDIDAQIAKLKSELAQDDTSGLIDADELLEDDDDDEDFSSFTPATGDFLTSTGEMIMMDPNDDGTYFKLKYIDIKNIAVTKRIRATGGFEDLTKSIKSTGLLKPISVAPTDSDGIYVLLDGYRRLLACARAGKRDIPCVINTKVSIPDIPILEAMYNQQKSYSINEQIEYIDYLEKQKGIMSASLIEYLLQMNSGDYSKLKDILEDNDAEIVGKLKEGLLSIAEAFKKLEQRRKKENPEQKDMRKATKVYEDDPDETIESIAGSGETGDEDLALSDAEMNNISVNATDLDDVEDDNLEEMIKEGNNISGYQPHKQNYKYREILDPALRKAVLVRDNNTCRVCGLSGQEFTEVLDIHHIQEVYLGGDDSMDNLITACTVCHKLIHMYGRGTLHIRPIDQFSESEQVRFKKIVKLGNKIRVDSKLKGIDPKKLKTLDNSDTIGRTKPGASQEAG